MASPFASNNKTTTTNTSSSTSSPYKPLEGAYGNAWKGGGDLFKQYNGLFGNNPGGTGNQGVFNALGGSNKTSPTGGSSVDWRGGNPNTAFMPGANQNQQKFLDQAQQIATNNAGQSIAGQEAAQQQQPGAGPASYDVAQDIRQLAANRLKQNYLQGALSNGGNDSSDIFGNLISQQRAAALGGLEQQVNALQNPSGYNNSRQGNQIAQTRASMGSLIENQIAQQRFQEYMRREAQQDNAGNLISQAQQLELFAPGLWQQIGDYEQQQNQESLNAQLREQGYNLDQPLNLIERYNALLGANRFGQQDSKSTSTTTQENDPGWATGALKTGIGLAAAASGIPGGGAGIGGLWDTAKGLFGGETDPGGYKRFPQPTPNPHIRHGY